MRLDRLLSLYLFHPLIQARSSKNSRSIEILMYHSISKTKEYARHPYYKINIGADDFRWQMNYLSVNGYRVISLREAINLIASERSKHGKILCDSKKRFSLVKLPAIQNEANNLRQTQLTTETLRSPNDELQKNQCDAWQVTSSHPANQLESPYKRQPFQSLALRRTVVLTFDDGYRDFYDSAWPILKLYGFPATVFLPTDFIGDERRKLSMRECLTWKEVRELSSEGVDFGAHTVSHTQLYHNHPDVVEKEVRDSKDAIETALGSRVNHYSYAYAFPEHDAMFVAFYRNALIKAGYKGGVTTKIGRTFPGDDPFTLKRIPINSGDDEALFRAKLEGAYDWLAWPQRMSKKLRWKVGS